VALGPELSVADEPAASLDLSVQAQMLELMQELQGRLGMSYLFISHYLNIVKLMASRLAVMYLGKFVEVGGVKDVFNYPAHPYTRALLSAVPSIGLASRQKRIVLAGEIPRPLNPPAGCSFHSRCPEAREICLEFEPELHEVAEGHLVACHLAR
jgi:oligopeptide/dipeptide ABC transporter ATP-binding protein